MYVFTDILTEWPPTSKLAAHSAYDMLSSYKYWIVYLLFPTSVFFSGNLFLIATFPDLSLPNCTIFNAVTYGSTPEIAIEFEYPHQIAI